MPQISVNYFCVENIYFIVALCYYTQQINIFSFSTGYDLFPSTNEIHEFCHCMIVDSDRLFKVFMRCI